MIRVAFADPPYIGQAARHYKGYPDYGGEVDHAELIARLVRDWPDGWALSCSSPSLKTILSLCPDGVRVAAWVKPFASFKANVNPGYCWEPLVWQGGRKRTRQQPTARDWVAVGITLKRGLVGAKPEAFCFWLFELLNLQPGDILDDLFPGSGAVGWAWQRYQHQLWSATEAG